MDRTHRLDEVFDGDNRIIFTGDYREVQSFLRSVRLPLSNFHVRIGASGQYTEAGQYLDAIRIQESWVFGKTLSRDPHQWLLDLANASPKEKAVYISTELVDKFYEMDPETEELLPMSECLRNGMIVLRGDVTRRINLEGHQETREKIYEARGRNRWCLVSDVFVYPHSVRFTANYGDGTKRRIKADLEESWIVNRDTISEVDPKGHVCPKCAERETAGSYSEARAVQKQMEKGDPADVTRTQGQQLKEYLDNLEANFITPGENRG